MVDQNTGSMKVMGITYTFGEQWKKLRSIVPTISPLFFALPYPPPAKSDKPIIPHKSLELEDFTTNIKKFFFQIETIGSRTRANEMPTIT